MKVNKKTIPKFIQSNLNTSKNEKGGKVADLIETELDLNSNDSDQFNSE